MAFDPFSSLSTLAASLASGSVSSVEVVGAYLDRAEAANPKLNAFTEIDRSGALAVAEARDRERRAGYPLPALHGLPVAFKDLFEIAGRVTAGGSAAWAGRRSRITATIVERLLAAGMIPFGKTQMVEFAFGGWGTNTRLGAPWNPWDLAVHRIPGGSSSGSAVAVAAGLVPVAIGSDTGGSVRGPAALNGLVGLKPTYGLVSLFGAIPLSATLDSVGPLARTVEDAALVTAAMAGTDPLDPTTSGVAWVDFVRAARQALPLAGLRIAALPEEGFPALTERPVVAAFNDAARLLGELGAVVETAKLPFDFDDLMRANGQLIATEAYALHRAYIEDPGLPINDPIRARILAAKGVSAADYIAALAARREAMSRFADWMRPYAALLTPTVPLAAVPVAEVDERQTTMAAFTRAVNYLGACGISLPAGFDARGLPLGVQLIGSPFSDATLIGIGRAFEAAGRFERRVPDLSSILG